VAGWWLGNCGFPLERFWLLIRWLAHIRHVTNATLKTELQCACRSATTSRRDRFAAAPTRLVCSGRTHAVEKSS
jgi:hypothetical protein